MRVPNQSKRWIFLCFAGGCQKKSIDAERGTNFPVLLNFTEPKTTSLSVLDVQRKLQAMTVGYVLNATLFFALRLSFFDAQPKVKT
mmetsp:Transcript_4256/g.6699  ORF Transcript_4256/g.6699 Transcript_4256/m.6699 type:complete len:86 (-) Transcript_4256:497-754(-)